MAEPPRVALTLLQCWHRIPGGTAVSILSLAEAMAATGKVDLIGVGPWGRSLPDPPWTPPIEVKRLGLPYQLVYDGWHHLRWPKVQRATGAVDIVHASTTTVPPSGGARLLVTVHDLFPMLAPAQFTRRGVRLLTRGIELARRRADLVLCPSEATLDDCVADGFDAERLRLIPWGVDRVEVTDEDRAEVRRTYGLDRPYVLWVGTIEPRKNLPTLLDAFARLGPRDEELVLAGPLGWNEHLEGHIAPIGDRVRRLGFVPREHLPALYAEARVFCLPSLREGFGLPALEAMAQGAPVIASAGTAIAEVVGPAGVLVHPVEVGEWAEALRTVLDDDALSAQLARDGRARAATYTWERAAAATIDAYSEVLG
jgi:glycosyltransferase involved in cell wall biosynthesis